MPRSRLAVLLEHFSQLDDGREQWRGMYPLSEMLLLLTCSTIAGCDEIVAWGEHHLKFLRQFAPFHFGIPCERWLRRRSLASTRSCSGVVSKAGSRTCGLTGTI